MYTAVLSPVEITKTGISPQSQFPRITKCECEPEKWNNKAQEQANEIEHQKGGASHTSEITGTTRRLIDGSLERRQESIAGT